MGAGGGKDIQPKQRKSRHLPARWRSAIFLPLAAMLSFSLWSAWLVSVGGAAGRRSGRIVAGALGQGDLSVHEAAGREPPKVGGLAECRGLSHRDPCRGCPVRCSSAPGRRRGSGPPGFPGSRILVSSPKPATVVPCCSCALRRRRPALQCRGALTDIRRPSSPTTSSCRLTYGARPPRELWRHPREPQPEPLANGLFWLPPEGASVSAVFSLWASSGRA